MDQEKIYVLTDRGTIGSTRWIVCELRNPKEHCSYGLIIHKHIYYKTLTNTITYKTETSADFPITDEVISNMRRMMDDELWRNGPGTQVGPPAPLRYKKENI